MIIGFMDDIIFGGRMPRIRGVKFLNTICASRVDPELIDEAFDRGAKGVFVVVCEKCKFENGDEKAEKRVALLKRLYEQMGLTRDIRIFTYAAGKEEKLLRDIEAFAKEVEG